VLNMSFDRNDITLSVFASALVGDDGRPLAVVHGMERALPGLRLGWTTSEKDDLIPLPHRDEWVASDRTDGGFPFLCNDDDNDPVTLFGLENPNGLYAGGPPHLEVHASLPSHAADLAQLNVVARRIHTFAHAPAYRWLRAPVRALTCSLRTPGALRSQRSP
jgi:hypothetical protein